MLAESLVLSTCGGAIGLAIAWAGREALLRLISADGSRLPVAAETDLRLLMFSAGVSIATAVLFGTVPAWRSARASVAASLATRNASVDRRTQWLGPALVVAQVAVSLVLLMGAGLFLRTLENLRSCRSRVRPGTARDARRQSSRRRLFGRSGDCRHPSRSRSAHGLFPASAPPASPRTA